MIREHHSANAMTWAWAVIAIAVAILVSFFLAGHEAHASAIDREPAAHASAIDREPATHALAPAMLEMMMRTAHPGRSPHSFELLESCGTNESSPLCDARAPTCKDPIILCRAPVFLAGAWRQVERKETARERFSVIAQALADEAQDVMEKSKGKAWPGSSSDFAVAMLAASYWSTGFREDIEVGRKRGPAKEACLADLQPLVAWKFAPFPHANLTPEQVAQRIVGSDYESLRRCYGAGLRALSSMRRWADVHCRGQVSSSYAGFAAYATGSSCQTTGKRGDYAMLREKLYRKYRNEL